MSSDTEQETTAQLAQLLEEGGKSESSTGHSQSHGLPLVLVLARDATGHRSMEHQDWNAVVLRKTRAGGAGKKAAQRDDVNSAMRSGAQVETVKKFAAGRSNGSVVGIDLSDFRIQ